MVKLDLTALIFRDLVESDKNAACKYASEVLRNNPSEHFLSAIADIFDGDLNGYGLTIKKPRGKPRKDLNEELIIGSYVINLVAANENETGLEHVESAVADAMIEFGLKRSTVMAAYSATKAANARNMWELGQSSIDPDAD